jgi:hypothetical protein
MKLTFCALCGSKKALEHHHVVPKSLGGSDEQENILTLCSVHHVMIHNLNDKRIHSASLIRQAKKNQKAKGEFLGGHIPFGYQLSGNKLIDHPEEQKILKDLRIRRVTGTSLSKLSKYLKNEYGIVRSKVWVGNVTKAYKE